eukprot:gene18941-25509_t
MTDGDASLCAVAVGLAQFHRANPFSAASGSATVMANGGISRKCTTTKRSVYPRVDPAVISMAVCCDCVPGSVPLVKPFSAALGSATVMANGGISRKLYDCATVTSFRLYDCATGHIVRLYDCATGHTSS